MDTAAIDTAAIDTAGRVRAATTTSARIFLTPPATLAGKSKTLSSKRLVRRRSGDFLPIPPVVQGSMRSARSR